MTAKRLGRGINALIRETPDETVAFDTTPHLSTKLISPNPYQPRQEFDQSSLKELAESIKEKGIIQPITVRSKGKRYELVAGERRFRAAKLAGLKKLPAHIVEIESDSELMEMAIIENLHRHDLNPIEEAMAYSKLSKEFGLRQEEIAQKVGKNRASIANYMRLLRLSRPLQEDIISGRITMGHAMALLSLSTEREIEILRRQILRDNLNVRQTEKLAKQKIKTSSKLKSKKKIREKDHFLEILETELARSLGTKVKVVSNKKGGTVMISFYSTDDLERIRDMLVSKII